MGMVTEKNIMLEINQYIKSDKIPYIIYADMDSLIKKNVCANIPENWATTKISEHVPCG